MQQASKLSADNMREAHGIIRELAIEQVWRDIGAQVNLIGSMKTGLLVKHLDIDFHVYTSTLDIADSFLAMSKIAANTAIQRMECRNLIDTEEHCIEWHAWYRTPGDRLWQIDIIHILAGSAFDGFAEKAAERILAVLTPETRRTILQLKFETPDDEHIPGIEYYMAVLRDGVGDYAAFTEWRARNAPGDIVLWTP